MHGGPQIKLSQKSFFQLKRNILNQKKNRKEKDFERYILQPCPLTFDGRYTPKPVSYNSSPACSKQS